MKLSSLIAILVMASIAITTIAVKVTNSESKKSTPSLQPDEPIKAISAADGYEPKPSARSDTKNRKEESKQRVRATSRGVAVVGASVGAQGGPYGAAVGAVVGHEVGKAIGEGYESIRPDLQRIEDQTKETLKRIEDQTKANIKGAGRIPGTIIKALKF